MSLDALQAAGAKVVGIKQTAKALQKKIAASVYIAADADEHITGPVREACEKQNIPCLVVQSMQVLGKACGIHAGASAAAILKN